MQNRLIETMKTFGLKVEVLGTDDEPSPDGQAIGDMLIRILSLEDENAALKAQVRYLRDYAISKACEVHQLKHGETPTKEEIRFLIGGIDGNTAVAADRAKADGGE